MFVPDPVTSNNPNVRPLGDAFFNDITRGYRQKAAYASVDVELVPQTLTLTAGTRYFSTNTTEVGCDSGQLRLPTRLRIRRIPVLITTTSPISIRRGLTGPTQVSEAVRT